MWLQVPGSKPSDQNWLYNLWDPVPNENVGLLLKNIKDFRIEQQNIKPSVSGPFYMQGPVLLCASHTHEAGPVSDSCILTPRLPSSTSSVVHLCGLEI